MACAPDAEAGAGALSSSFARVELFLQPATNSGRTRISEKIRRSIPVTKRAEYHVLFAVTSGSANFPSSLCHFAKSGIASDSPLPLIRKLALTHTSLVLVSCPLNKRYIAGGRLAVFQGASEAPVCEPYGSSEQRGKTANRPRPRGLR